MDTNLSQRHTRNHIFQLFYLLPGVSSLGPSRAQPPAKSWQTLLQPGLPDRTVSDKALIGNSGGQGEATLGLRGQAHLGGQKTQLP